MIYTSFVQNVWNTLFQRDWHQDGCRWLGNEALPQYVPCILFEFPTDVLMVWDSSQQTLCTRAYYQSLQTPAYSINSFLHEFPFELVAKSLEGWWGRSLLVSQSRRHNFRRFGSGISTRREVLSHIWTSHIPRLLVGWHLLLHPVANLRYGLWQLHLLVFLNLLRLLCLASPPKTRTDSSNCRNSRSS